MEVMVVRSLRPVAQIPFLLQLAVWLRFSSNKISTLEIRHIGHEMVQAQGSLLRNSL
jgi:hypothetical protein